MRDLSGKVVMVSGAARGIGRAVAERLLAAGCQVSAGVRDTARAPEGTVGFAYDANRQGSAAGWVEATVARFGRVDALVNAAGINPRATLLDGPDDAFQDLWTVNAMGPIQVIRAAWPHLVAGGEGRVINIASLSGKRVRNDNLGYAMSKFAVMALTQEVRRLGWEHGIRATALCPGFVDTDMTAHVTKWPREQMSRPEDLALLAETLLRLPNTASVAELLVNCRHEDTL
ncbi:SDR family NAD(P)-dependent oxidoreductase [Pseudoroseomonas wenyumeiae]|uniref:SDR family NAD(P)-dependent oxidoreductase n=1 Tax=Teichococcus wenyumeiae TaxID=2478470 RepID=A0A3A9JLP6_9PROT|nr:SDR family NAD(P)-dependent oxidoreductase [Pseudoroseomonas wenyumeiae]RKK05693.1 SDR family NAD(P)-dependent oxidoreductase [Pseudoroseomonas wenyumeiae]RMI25996.1 SDR family NAD(P)-dependent oxidoreductase [Pseudoroseomonas wenyumeiae]